MSARQAVRTTFITSIAWTLVLAGVCLLVSGCGAPELEDGYGQRRGIGSTKSVNGTAVFGEMFEKAGHKVFSWSVLSPRLKQRADCIVWFPDNFDLPKNEVRYWLETWLAEQPGRTLIFVGRDYDAARWYWEKMTPQSPAGQKTKYQKNLVDANHYFIMRRNGKTTKEEYPWFNVDHKLDRRAAKTLDGDSAWLAGIDPTKLEIELNGRFEPGVNAKVLLESSGDMLLSRQAIDQSQLLVVTNGSFLLNLPLVNHEHRKLAGKLVDAIGPNPKTVAFLESSYLDPRISEKDPLKGMPTGLEIFNVWPTNWILIHLAVVGILFCFWRFPIFGLARAAKPPELSDFGRHLDALGELLARSGDMAYAQEKVKAYQQKIKPSE